MNATLSHLRVLDLSRILAGPWATQILADMGAEVIKIERPDQGDDTRSWGPPYVRDQHGHETTEAAYYLSTNRGKKSIAIDITTEAGQKIIYQMVRESDVVVENFKVGSMKKYGLDYETLTKINSRLIYCSITGFGQTGPYANRPGYDFAIQAMGGLMSITGQRDDLPGGGPQKVGVALADVTTGLYATIAILGALANRSETGEGQYIDLALLDVQLAVLANQSMNYLTSGIAPERLGNEHPNIVPYQSFATADDYIILAVGNDSQFQRFCALINESDLADDQRFNTNKQRVHNRDELIPLIEKIMLQKNSEEWLQQLESVKIPCGPINSIDKVFENEQIKHRQMEIEMNHPKAQNLKMVANPIKFSKTPNKYDRPPPLLAEHTNEILKDLLQMNENEIDFLKDTGVVQ
ncbi:MAG: CoA transferase [Proteobacteria bacterium]|nr:CoA transferase [Pseudomonadota bacterium]NOG59602.1 CoA transferase [Pseudomonadota bacterium]